MWIALVPESSARQRMQDESARTADVRTRVDGEEGNYPHGERSYATLVHPSPLSFLKSSHCTSSLTGGNLDKLATICRSISPESRLEGCSSGSPTNGTTTGTCTEIFILRVCACRRGDRPAAAAPRRHLPSPCSCSRRPTCTTSHPSHSPA